MELSIFLEIPDGWNKLFNQMCEDINKVQDLKEIEFVQVKEKFGAMRVYTNNTNEQTDVIIMKYEYISRFVCNKCGNPACYQTEDYILPYCNDCFKDFVRHKPVEDIEFDPILKLYPSDYDAVKVDCSDIWNRYIGGCYERG